MQEVTSYYSMDVENMFKQGFQGSFSMQISPGSTPGCDRHEEFGEQFFGTPLSRTHLGDSQPKNCSPNDPRSHF